MTFHIKNRIIYHHIFFHLIDNLTQIQASQINPWTYLGSTGKEKEKTLHYIYYSHLFQQSIKLLILLPCFISDDPLIKF